jgi:hypothetical protein
MNKSRICVLGAAAVIGAAVATTGASAAMAASSPTNKHHGDLYVGSGSLGITAPGL